MSAYVITVAQQKGGAGKSTLATHLAVAFAKMGYSTMLFDTDPQGTTTHWHAQRKTSDIGLMATSGWRLTRDLAMAKEGNDIIIIDTPPHAEMDIKVSTRAADIVLVPIQPSPADLWAVKETFNTIAGESRQALAVLNRVVHRANITIEIREKLKALDVPVAQTEIGSRVMFAASMETGLTVLDGFANPSENEIMGLVRELAEKIGITLKPSASKATTAKPAVKVATPDSDASAKEATPQASTSSKKAKKMPTIVKKKAPAKAAAPKKATTAKPAAKKVAKPATPKKAAKPAAPKAKPAAKKVAKPATPKKVAKPATPKAKPAPKKVTKPATPKKVAKPATPKAKPAAKKPAVKKAPAKKAAPKKAAKAQLEVVNGGYTSKKAA